MSKRSLREVYPEDEVVDLPDLNEPLPTPPPTIRMAGLYDPSLLGTANQGPPSTYTRTPRGSGLTPRPLRAGVRRNRMLERYGRSKWMFEGIGLTPDQEAKLMKRFKRPKKYRPKAAKWAGWTPSAKQVRSRAILKGAWVNARSAGRGYTTSDDFVAAAQRYDNPTSTAAPQAMIVTTNG